MTDPKFPVESCSGQKELIAAAWLFGMYSAFKARGITKSIDRSEFFKHVNTAFAVTKGLVFNPIPVCEMVSYVESLSDRMSPPIVFEVYRPERESPLHAFCAGSSSR